MFLCVSAPFTYLLRFATRKRGIFFLLDAWIKTLAYFSSWTTRDAPRWADLISLCFRCSNTNRENPLREIPFAQVEIARILFRSEQ
jgi:hypothetical protein